MIYNAWLLFKYRPRLSVWGKIVAGWLSISFPWVLALAWYTATGHLAQRFVVVVTLSALASFAYAVMAPMIYDSECKESPKWHIFKERDE